MSDFLDEIGKLIAGDRTPEGDPNLKRFGNQGFKRNGWLGQIPVEGGYATEYSIGREGEMPSIVPTMTDEQLRRLKSLMRYEGQPFPNDIDKTAKDWAATRLATGQSPFAGDNESPTPTRPPGPYSDEYVTENPSAGRLNALLASFRKLR